MTYVPPQFFHTFPTGSSHTDWTFLPPVANFFGAVPARGPSGHLYPFVGGPVAVPLSQVEAASLQAAIPVQSTSNAGWPAALSPFASSSKTTPSALSVASPPDFSHVPADVLPVIGKPKKSGPIRRRGPHWRRRGNDNSYGDMMVRPFDSSSYFIIHSHALRKRTHSRYMYKLL